MISIIISKLFGGLFTLEEYSQIADISGIISIFLIAIYFKIEHSEVVKATPVKKSKMKRVLIIMLTLGIAVLVYRKRYDIAYHIAKRVEKPKIDLKKEARDV